MRETVHREHRPLYVCPFTHPPFVRPTCAGQTKDGVGMDRVHYIKTHYRTFLDSREAWSNIRVVAYPVLIFSPQSSFPFLFFFFFLVLLLHISLFTFFITYPSLIPPSWNALFLLFSLVCVEIEYVLTDALEFGFSISSSLQLLS